MRVVSGKFRGRTLVAPDGLDVRPTTDRVKENLFNLLQFRIRDAVVLDLFAGSGALGIECISREAKEVWFVDQSAKSIAAINKNLRGAEFFGGIKHDDFRAVLSSFASKRFDLIFLDPPYSKGLGEQAIEIIRDLNLLSEGGLVVFEHLAEVPYEPCEGMRVADCRKYGQIEITLVEKA